MKTYETCKIFNAVRTTDSQVLHNGFISLQKLSSIHITSLRLSSTHAFPFLEEAVAHELK